jgi:GTPase SAR1 family protein
MIKKYKNQDHFIILIVGPKGVGKTSLVRSLQLIYGDKSPKTNVKPAIYESTLTKISKIRHGEYHYTIVDTLRPITNSNDLSLYQGYVRIADFIICLFDAHDNLDSDDYNNMKKLFQYFYERDKYACLIGNKADLCKESRNNHFKRNKFIYDGHFVITAIDPLSVEILLEEMMKNQEGSKPSEKTLTGFNYYFFCCPYFKKK